MGVGIELYRMRVGQYSPGKNIKHRLNYIDFICINLFLACKSVSQALVLSILIFTLTHQLGVCLKPLEMKHVDSNVQKITSVNVNLRLFIILFLLFVIQILLILAGIEVNPGPSDDIDSSQSSINSTDMSDFGELFSKSVSILHLNVQSLAPKIDLIQAEYSDFDILAFSETWLNNNHTDESIEILNYQHPFRRDRGPHKVGGGIIVYVKNDIHAQRRIDLESESLEAIWLEIKFKDKKALLGTFYIPPNSGPDIWEKIEYSLDMASNDNTINYIMATGDFNDNQLAPVNSKITPLLSQFSLTQLIDEPTHFTESSSSLLDLFITNDAHIITYCGVGPPLLDQIRFHCPIISLLNFPKCRQKTFKRKIWLYDRGDYDRYRNILSEKNWDSVINLNNVEQFTTEITKTIIEAAEKCIPNKIITVRKNEPPWLTNDVKKKIRKKNRIHRKAKKYNNPSDWSKFKKIRNEVTSLIRKSKEEYNNNLIKKIMNSSPSTTNWWKTVKQISGLKANDASVPPLMVNNNLIFDEIEKANEFNRPVIQVLCYLKLLVI
ncbi:Hypothetical predicted protein [Mytilus galloprovincialis]|uniref:Endonuclease/exonuclease/phosphatase domain-containing protein n=1 Tax=Mytilus galloprovincialis TaxID=29158 RepID=A0A8B6GJT9_MYTGA|nr:Hypothetical predicted protein [Mytilus galloprovincialis]